MAEETSTKSVFFHCLPREPEEDEEPQVMEPERVRECLATTLSLCLYLTEHEVTQYLHYVDEREWDDALRLKSVATDRAKTMEPGSAAEGSLGGWPVIQGILDGKFELPEVARASLTNKFHAVPCDLAEELTDDLQGPRGRVLAASEACYWKDRAAATIPDIVRDVDSLRRGFDRLPDPESRDLAECDTFVAVWKFSAMKEQAGRTLAQSLVMGTKRLVFDTSGTVPLIHCLYLKRLDLHLDWIASSDITGWLSTVAPKLKPILRAWGFEQVDDRGYHWRPPTGDHGERAVLILFAWDVHVFSAAHDSCENMIIAHRGSDFENDSDAVGGVAPEGAHSPDEDESLWVPTWDDVEALSQEPLPPPPRLEYPSDYQEFCGSVKARGGVHDAFVSVGCDARGNKQHLVVVVWKKIADRTELEDEERFNVEHFGMDQLQHTATLGADGFLNDWTWPEREEEQVEHRGSDFESGRDVVGGVAPDATRPPDEGGSPEGGHSPDEDDSPEEFGSPGDDWSSDEGESLWVPTWDDIVEVNQQPLPPPPPLPDDFPSEYQDYCVQLRGLDGVHHAFVSVGCDAGGNKKYLVVVLWKKIDDRIELQDEERFDVEHVGMDQLQQSATG